MWFYPFTDSKIDIEATERAKTFLFGWYMFCSVDSPVDSSNTQMLIFFSNIYFFVDELLQVSLDP